MKDFEVQVGSLYLLFFQHDCHVYFQTKVRIGNSISVLLYTLYYSPQKINYKDEIEFGVNRVHKLPLRRCVTTIVPDQCAFSYKNNQVLQNTTKILQKYNTFLTRIIRSIQNATKYNHFQSRIMISEYNRIHIAFNSI